MTKLKKLPLDVSTFSSIMNDKDNYLYVDKTENIYRLFTGDSRYYFLARPRRFGKSLLVSTLAELFAGNKKLFEGLWIATSDWEWKQHPVIQLDFSKIAHQNPDDLKKSLHVHVGQYAAQYNVDLAGLETLEDKFNTLIVEAAKKIKVVILIDEYDKPIIDHITNLEIAEKNREILKSFYDVLKGLDANLRAIFVTGVSKFSKTSLFSGMNNLNDISQKPEAATLLGYTQQELEHYLTPYIIEVATKQGVSKQEILDEMKEWYNGYRFSEDDVRVYNPFSVLYYLSDQKCNNYWIKSGTPTFLINLLKMNYQTLHDFSGTEVDDSTFDPLELTAKIPLIPLLYQTGYLTINTVFQEFDLMGQNPVPKYKLDYPNREVRESLLKYLLVAMTFLDENNITDIIAGVKKALANNNIQDFCQQLRILFAQIPSTLHLDFEAYYHSLLRVMLLFMKIKADPEVPTDKGFIDLVIPTLNRIFIIELKFVRCDKRKKSVTRLLSEEGDVTCHSVDNILPGWALRVTCRSKASGTMHSHESDHVTVRRNGDRQYQGGRNLGSKGMANTCELLHKTS